MTDRPRKPPEQASLDSQFDADRPLPEGQFDPEAEPSGIDSIPLLQESHEFPEDRELAEAVEPVEVLPEQVPATETPEAPVETAEPEDLDAGEEAVEQLAFDDPGFDEAKPEAHDEVEPAGPGWDEKAVAESDSGEPEQPVVDSSESLQKRFPQQWIVAGLADLAVNLAVVCLGAVATWQLGIPVRWSGWPGYLGFALSFSFLYTSMPLAFWGQTPGMALFGLRAADGDRQLSFGQTALRWGAAGLTLGTLGLPWLLARSGRPLADRLSRSETLVWHEPKD